MKAKKWIALVLAMLMVAAIFTACTNSETPSNNGGGNSGNSGNNNNGGGNSGNSGNNNGGGDSGNTDDEDEEMVNITFWFPDLGGTTGSAPKANDVIAALNEITEEQINVHVDVVWFTGLGDYGTQLVLGIANKEAIDVALYMPSGGAGYINLLANKCMMDITDITAEYGKDLMALFGEDLMAGTVIDGRLYGCSTYRQLNSNWYINMRTDILEQLNLMDQATSMKTWADYEALMETVKNAGVVQYAVGAGGGHGFVPDSGCIFGGTYLSDTIAFDTLGDSLYTIMTDQDGHVYSMVETDECLQQFKMFANWMAAGYVYPDTPYDQDSYQAVMGKGIEFSSLCMSEFGVEVNWKQSTNYDLTCIQLTPGYLSTAVCQKFGIFVPSTAKEPEAAVKFINLLYTTPELMNLVVWGIKDETYVVNDKGEACYPEGTDRSTCGYHGMDFCIGNQFLCMPWEGNGTNFRAEALEDFKNAPVSKYMGLTVDTSTIDDLVAALSAVCEEFRGIMASGYYTDSLYKEYVDKLHAAGVDDYVDFYQNAVNDFIA